MDHYGLRLPLTRVTRVGVVLQLLIDWDQRRLGAVNLGLTDAERDEVKLLFVLVFLLCIVGLLIFVLVFMTSPQLTFLRCFSSLLSLLTAKRK